MDEIASYLKTKQKMDEIASYFEENITLEFMVIMQNINCLFSLHPPPIIGTGQIIDLGWFIQNSK